MGSSLLMVVTVASSREQVAAVEYMAAPVVRVGLQEVLHPIHPLDHHSHHPEECYTHPVGQLEVFQQVYIPVNAYLDISGIMFHQTTLVQR